MESKNTSTEPGTELLTQDPQSAEINTDENAGDGPSSEGVQISEGEQIPEGEQSIEQTEESSTAVKSRRSSRQPVYPEKYKELRRDLGLLSCNNQPHKPQLQ